MLRVEHVQSHAKSGREIGPTATLFLATTAVLLLPGVHATAIVPVHVCTNATPSVMHIVMVPMVMVHVMRVHMHVRRTGRSRTRDGRESNYQRKYGYEGLPGMHI
jgi:hypothetical protein